MNNFINDILDLTDTENKLCLLSPQLNSGEIVGFNSYNTFKPSNIDDIINSQTINQNLILFITILV